MSRSAGQVGCSAPAPPDCRLKPARVIQHGVLHDNCTEQGKTRGYKSWTSPAITSTKSFTAREANCQSLAQVYMPEDDWKISIGKLLNYQNKVSSLQNPRQAGGNLLFGYVSVSFDFSRVTSLPIKQHYPAA